LIARLAPVIASVASAVKIETEPTADDDEPGREAAPWVIREFSQPTTIVRAQLVEDERVGVHHLVVALENRSSDVEQKPRVVRDEAAPSRLEVARVVGCKSRD
jgi:hypothetical protein